MRDKNYKIFEKQTIEIRSNGNLVKDYTRYVSFCIILFGCSYNILESVSDYAFSQSPFPHIELQLRFPLQQYSTVPNGATLASPVLLLCP